MLVLGILLAFAWAWWWLELRLDGAVPGGAHLKILRDFFAGAVDPVVTPTVLAELGRGAWNTVVFATAAMTLSVAIGAVLGFFASTAWWSEESSAGDNSCITCLRCTVCPVLYGVTRIVIALFRSIHELFWAVILLCALGINPFSGVIAIAIPYGCTLAKVFSEMIDEAPRAAAIGLRTIGASPMQVYCFGLLPSALGDLTAYTFYRFECTLRSAAILGFFGFETLGYFIKQAYGENAYGETWTHLYGLMILVIAADWWSGAFRRSFVQ